MAMENNFFGNNERFYVENEFSRLNAAILSAQQENEELKMKIRVMRQAQNSVPDSVNEERTKLLYAERERLFGEIESLKKKMMALEQELSGNRIQGIHPSIPQHIHIIQDGGQAGQQAVIQEALRDKERQLEELKQGIEELIDENKDLKRELDRVQMQMEQLEIDKSYLLQRQQLNQGQGQENNLDVLAKMHASREVDFNIQQRSLEHLVRRLNEQLQLKEFEIQQARNGMNLTQKQQLEANQQKDDQLRQKDEQIKQLLEQLSANDQDQFQQNSQQLRQSPQRSNLNMQVEHTQHIQGLTHLLNQHQQENLKLKKQIQELHSRKDNEFLTILDQKDKHIDAMRRKYTELQQGDQPAIYGSEIKRLKDLLEQRSYEAQEWKDKCQLLQAQLRNKDKQDPKTYSNALLEQEYRKLRQLHEMKTLEAEEYRQRLQQNNQDVGARKPDTESELKKHQILLQMRSAECEEWRQKCLRQQQLGLPSTADAGAKDELLRKHQTMLEAKHRECEDWKNKYSDVLKNRDKGSAEHIEQLQAEVRKHQRQHEMKSAELQDLQPKLQRASDIAKERDQLETELRRTKIVLEQHIIENEQLKRKLNQGNLGASSVNDKSSTEKQIRDQQTKILMLQSELQKLQGHVKEKLSENDKLKQSHMLQQDQIKSIALNHRSNDQKVKELSDEHERVKAALRDKAKENEDLKRNQGQLQLVIQNQQKEAQSYKQSGQSTEALKAQISILQSKLADYDKRNQQLNEQLTKMGNQMRDMSGENDKLKQAVSKGDGSKKDYNDMLNMVKQLKAQLEQKQKENDQLKLALQQTQKKLSDLQVLENHTRLHNDKLTHLVQDFRGGLKKP